jgi:hypothetical protein
MPERPDVLEQGRQEGGLSHSDLRFESGGMRTALEVEPYLSERSSPLNTTAI